MSARRLTSTGLVLLCALAGGLLFSLTPAQAAVTHKYLSQITEIPAEGPHKEAVASHGPLAQIRAMTVDSGRLWVDEAESREGGVRRLDAFDASTGSFEAQLIPPASIRYPGSAAIRNETPGLPETQLYVSNWYEGVAVLGASGNLLGTWTETPNGPLAPIFQGGVAVDNSTSVADWAAGDVYVVEGFSSPQPAVDVFKPEAGGKEEYITRLTGPQAGVSFDNPTGVVVDEANGDVLVAEEGAVDIFEPTTLDQYALVRRLTGTPQGAFKRDVLVAVDGGAGEGAGDVYIAETEGKENSVYEFDAGGEYLGKLAGTQSGVFGGMAGLAVDPETHDVYVGAEPEVGGVAHYVVDVFAGQQEVVPDVTTGPASVVTPTGATLNGTVDPDKAGPATCAFVWGTSEAFGEEQPCGAGVPEGNAPVAVQAPLGKLQPDTTYYYRLQATNTADGLTNPGEEFQDQHFTTPGPGIVEASASNVAATSATLDATIDPNGAPTSFYFEYGTSSEYGSVAPAPPGAAVGSGQGGLEVDRHVQGLVAGTVYHYRVVAVSEVTYEVEPGKVETRVETFYGADETLTTQSAGGFVLPDGRQWEMVSQPDKLGADILPLDEQIGGGQTQASVDGSAIAYAVNTPTEAGAPGFPGIATVLSTRGPGGWSSRDLATAHRVATNAGASGTEFRLFSSDLSLALVQPFGVFEPSLSPEASEQTVFLHTDFLGGSVEDPCVSGCFRPLVTGAPGFANVPAGSVFGQINLEPFGYTGKHCPPAQVCGPQLEDATPDLGHVVLKTGSGTPEFPYGLYEWAAGKLTLVSELPGGGPVPSDGTSGPFLGGGFDGTIIRHAISKDGSRVIFEGNEGNSSQGHIYMHDLATGTTVQLDAVQGGSATPAEDDVANFKGASSDGSRVFFTAEAPLTADAGERLNLYECEMVEEAGGLRCELSDLTPQSSSGAPGEALGLLAVSEDGSYVYFGAKGVLENGGVPVPGAVRGGVNLYVRHDGVTKLVAVVSGEDEQDWGRGATLLSSTGSVSSNGRWLAFMSSGDLTGYDSRDALTGTPDQEVYLYDAETGRLVCASCDPSGARPVGVEARDSPLGSAGYQGGSPISAAIPAPEAFNGGESGIARQAYQTRYLSDSGRLFFDSDDALVPQDVNGTWDVYQYEPPGVGNCAGASASFSARSDGCVGLISSGGSPQESAFLDAGEGGGDVFFLTEARLVPQDYDQSYDVYDAHECMAVSPCTPVAAVAPPACSSGDACKTAPAPQPTEFGAPASATFSGAGNVTPAPPAVIPKVKSKGSAKCRRGFEKRRGRCVKRPGAKRSRAAKRTGRGRR